jgi:cellulose synthase/poly-beta-1,6-N-acetylglucosamine synthase-like glycosyltransferase
MTKAVVEGLPPDRVGAWRPIPKSVACGQGPPTQAGSPMWRNHIGSKDVIQIPDTTSILVSLYLVFICMMTLQSAFNLRLRLFIWGSPERIKLNKSPTHYAPPKYSFTVLVPAHHEEAVIEATIDKICQADYPSALVQIVVVCESGDIETITKVRDKLAELGKEHVRLVVYDDRPINKPHGLNKGFQAATGEIVTIFDAEDEPHADIFLIINTILVEEDIDIVQSGVHLMNYESRWFSALSVLEYYFWFKSTLHYFALSNMVPLGGNTVFVKRHLLEDLGGWDEDCLTEDADIGIRLSALGARVRVICDDEHVTREECPISMRALVRQRTRWHQGFFQVFLKGDWLRLPKLSQRELASYVLLMPLAQALFSIMLPVSLLMIFLVKLPVWLAMLTYLPVYMFGLQVLLDLAGLLEFIHVQKTPFHLRVLLITPIAFFPYQWLLSLATFRAIVRQLSGHTDWEKTAHHGVHRQARSAA